MAGRDSVKVKLWRESKALEAIKLLGYGWVVDGTSLEKTYDNWGKQEYVRKAPVGFMLQALSRELCILPG